MDLSKSVEQTSKSVAVPRAPTSLAETGLQPGFLLALMIKIVYRLGIEQPTDISRAIKLPVPLVEKLLADAVDKKLLEMLGQLGASMTAEMRYGLTSKGKAWALEALAQSEWVGPAPVPLELYTQQVKAQSIRGEVLTRPMLEAVFKDLTLRDSLMGELGPAVNSGASILLYGPPGNGKSTISEAICRAFASHVFMPYAIEVDNQILTMFDPTVHTRVAGDKAAQSKLRRTTDFDQRYVAIARPQVTTGGELTLDMLDLTYSPTSRTYEAPLQLKAAGGVFVIDDFGRQRQSPQQIVNRMIIPLEAGVDYLSLQTGRKFATPFDALLILSTNIPPSELVDDAALRRLRYKILIDSPDRDTYIEIFARTANRFGMELTDEILAFVLMELYPNQPGAGYQAFHPRFLIEQTRSICTYEQVEPQLTPDFLRRAWRNLFTQD